MVQRRLGKGTTIDMQPCTDDGGDPPLVTTDLTDTGPWVNLGCTFGVQPPSCVWDTIQGDQCLEDTGDQPTVDIGDIQPDNPSFTPPFDPGDSEYQLIEDWCSTSQCMAFRYTYPGGATQYFYGRIQSVIPDAVERSTFMRSEVVILRTSQIYRTDTDVPTGSNFSCQTCREVD